MGKYDDILNCSRPLSRTHPRLSMESRAAQFSPFAALTGYDDAVEEEGRLTETQHELSEEEMADLNESLQFLLAHSTEHPRVRAEYFVPDEKKEGGSYAVKEGAVRAVDPANGFMEFADRERIKLEVLRGIEIL